MKELKITPPEGYEIDKEKSTLEHIVFKPLNKKPTWKDFGEVSGWHTDAYSNIVESLPQKADDQNVNTWPTKEEAEAALALSQLCQWRDKYNGGWSPNWLDDNFKFTIVCCRYHIQPLFSDSTSRPLAFKSSEIRDKFLEDFRELIEIAKPLL